MPAPISPWDYSAELVSPDGCYRACLSSAVEIAMGGPTAGRLVITENKPRGRCVTRQEGCSPSFVWAENSGALAFARWTDDRMQRLVILSVPSGDIQVLPGEFSVLELHSFEGGIVRGIDSPIHLPRKIELMAPPKARTT